MHLTAKEHNRLTVFTLAELARRRRARGHRLNAPEATALICDEIFERAWDGATLGEVVAHARTVLTRAEVMDGVPAVVRHVEVDALFPSGTALVAVDDPIGPADDGAAPGVVSPADEPIALNAGRPVIELDVRNTGSHPVQVTSHYHFAEANPVLAFDRDAARGRRLDVPAGSAVGWGAGETRRVALVPFAGEGVARGFGAGPGQRAGDG